MSPVDFRQEYEASFDALSHRVYPEFDKGNMGDVKDGKDVVWIGLDFNIRQMTAVCANSHKWGLEIFATHSLTSTNTVEMAKLLVKKYPNRQINICPDPAGRARSTKAESGVTDHSILKDYGMNVILPKGMLKINDRLKSVNALILNGNGDRNLIVDHSCGDLERALLLHQYDEKTQLPDKKSKGNIDDIVDSLGYLVWITHPIKHITKFEIWR